MPKKKALRKFAYVECEILESKAWLMLTHAQRVIYLHLKGEFRGMNGDNLELPYLSKMKGIVKSKPCFYSGMRRLEELGFIDRASGSQKVKFINGCPKTPKTIYKLSGRWRIHGKDVEEYGQERSEAIQTNLFGEYHERQENETEPVD